MADKPLGRLWQIILSFWNRLVEPSAVVTHRPHRRQCRLMASILLTLIFLTLVSVVTQPLYYPNKDIFTVIETYLMLLLLPALGFALYLNYRGWYKYAGVIAVGSAVFIIFVGAVPEKDPNDVYLLYYLVIPIVITGIFFSNRVVIALAGFCAVGLHFFPILFPQAPKDNIPLIFISIVAFMILLTNWHRHQLENERKAQLSENEYELRLLAENTLDIIYRCNADGVIQYINPSIQTLLGYPVGDYLGKRLRTERTHPEDRAKTLFIFQKMVAENVVMRVEYRYLHANGSYIWLETLAQPILEKNGKASGYLLVSRDITERKRAEDALRASEQRYRTLARSLPDITLFLFDHDLRYLIVEGDISLLDAEISPHDLEGKTLWEVLPPDTAANLAPLYQSALAGQESKVEHTYNDHIFQIYAAPVQDDSGSIYAGMIVSRDITEMRLSELHRLEAAAERERVQVLRRFIDNAASHDLRTPLTIMKTSLYLLSRVEDKEKRERYIENIDSQATHIERVFENILSMSQLYKTTEETHFMPFEVNRMIREVLSNAQLSAQNKHHQITFTPDTDLSTYLGDEAALQQAITHLINNAINFTPDNGQIHIRTSSSAQDLVIEIEDNGIGIEDDKLKQIFEPFYRVDQSRQMRMGEMGLGLAIVRRIIAAHHGKIEVESQVGKGSLFRVYLPLNPA